MKKILFEALLQVVPLVPFLLLLLKNKTKINFTRILIFVAINLIYQIALVLPKINPAFDFIKSDWNWDGKLFGLLISIIFYFVFKSFFKENDFFKLKQKAEGFKSALYGALSVVILSTVVWYLLGKSPLDYETLAFQLTLPGIDEEMMFRGILLGLLATAMKDKIKFLGNPAVLFTSILFGLMHALTLDKNLSIDFEPIYFVQTFFAGYIWGWVTLKSRSIFLAILSHNLSNFFGTLATMIK